MRAKKERIVLVTLFAVLSLSTLVLAVDCPIPDTGQTKCYDNTQEITCPQPAEPFYGQDAQFPCNPHSYTKLDASGNALPESAPSWVMVRDNVTGLIWEKDTAPNVYTWQMAMDYCENITLGVYSDWRLPTIKELSTLVDSSIPYPGPTINTGYFPYIQASGYWSSTTYAGRPDGAWFVTFYDGYVLDGSKSSYGYYVRAVRGGQCGSFDNFVDNGDGTVSDTDTGLMWQKDTAPDTYTWKQALSYCESSTLAEYNDWRLPNRNELQFIVDYNRYDPSIDPVFNAVLSSYWSSTTYADDPSGAWIVYFGAGDVYYDSKSGIYGYVRAVRGPVVISPELCPVEELYGEYSEQTELLRYLRDNVLSQTPEGQELIRLYYELSPVIVEMMNEDEQFKEEVKEMIDGVVKVIWEKVFKFNVE